jgi:hypothetical protein
MAGMRQAAGSMAAIAGSALVIISDKYILKNEDT